jgi:hypothetical protein
MKTIRRRSAFPDPIQEVILSSYDGAELIDVDGIKSGGVPTRLCGDGLFSFLLTELSHSQDCTNIEEALRRIDLIARQVEGVRSALLAAKNAPAHHRRSPHG